MRPVPVLRIRGHLLVPVRPDMGDDMVQAFQNAVLTAIEAEQNADGGLLLDISALEIVDTYVARVIADTAAMAGLMGRRTVVCGMRPEVAGTLVQMGYLLQGVDTALDLDDGLDLLGLPR